MLAAAELDADAASVAAGASDTAFTWSAIVFAATAATLAGANAARLVAALGGKVAATSGLALAWVTVLLTTVLAKVEDADPRSIAEVAVTGAAASVAIALVASL